MKSRKLIGVYTGLLIIAVATMIMLWRLKTMPKAEVFPRDYPEIKEEGILRLVTEYNQSGYYVAGDTIEGFQYELSQAIAQLSGLEIQIFLEMSLAESFDMLEENNCDAVARNIPITSEIKEKYLFTEPIVLDKQVLIQRTEAANNGLKPIRNQLDLAGKTLYIPKDSPAQLRLQNLGHEIGDLRDRRRIILRGTACHHGCQRRYRLCRLRPADGCPFPKATPGNRYQNRHKFHATPILGSPQRFPYPARQPEQLAGTDTQERYIRQDIQEIL